MMSTTQSPSEAPQSTKSFSTQSRISQSINQTINAFDKQCLLKDNQSFFQEAPIQFLQESQEDINESIENQSVEEIISLLSQSFGAMQIDPCNQHLSAEEIINLLQQSLASEPTQSLTSESTQSLASEPTQSLASEPTQSLTSESTQSLTSESNQSNNQSAEDKFLSHQSKLWGEFLTTPIKTIPPQHQPAQITSSDAVFLLPVDKSLPVTIPRISFNVDSESDDDEEIVIEQQQIPKLKTNVFDIQKEGMRIFNKLNVIIPQFAPKITGMLLAQPEAEIKSLRRDSNLIAKAIEAAKVYLQKYYTSEPMINLLASMNEGFITSYEFPEKGWKICQPYLMTPLGTQFLNACPTIAFIRMQIFIETRSFSATQMASSILGTPNQQVCKLLSTTDYLHKVIMKQVLEVLPKFTKFAGQVSRMSHSQILRQAVNRIRANQPKRPKKIIVKNKRHAKIDKSGFITPKRVAKAQKIVLYQSIITAKPVETKEETKPIFNTPKIQKTKTSFLKQHACNKTCCKKHQYRYTTPVEQSERQTLLKMLLRLRKRNDSDEFRRIYTKLCVDSAQAQSSDEVVTIVELITNWAQTTLGVHNTHMITLTATVISIAASLYTVFKTNQKSVRAAAIVSIISSFIAFISSILANKMHLKVTAEQQADIAEYFVKNMIAQTEEPLLDIPVKKPVHTNAGECSRVVGNLINFIRTPSESDLQDFDTVDLTPPPSIRCALCRQIPSNATNLVDLEHIITTQLAEHKPFICICNDIQLPPEPTPPAQPEEKEPEEQVPEQQPEKVEQVIKTLCPMENTDHEGFITEFLNYCIFEDSEEGLAYYCSEHPGISMPQVLIKTLDDNKAMINTFIDQAPIPRAQELLNYISELYECDHSNPNGSILNILEEAIPEQLPVLLDTNGISVLCPECELYIKYDPNITDPREKKAISECKQYFDDLMVEVQSSRNYKMSAKNKKNLEKIIKLVTTMSADNMIDAIPEAQEEVNVGDTMINVVTILGTIMLGVVGGVASSNFKDLNVTGGLSMISNLMRITTTDTFTSFKEFISFKILGNEDPKLDIKNALAKQTELMNSFMAKPYDTIVDDAKFLLNYSECIKRSRSMFTSYASNKDYTLLATALNRKLELAEQRYAAIKHIYDGLGSRQVPVGIMVSGEKGIGKTFANIAMGNMIATKEYQNEMPYVHDCGNDFYRPYEGQRVFVSQEVGNTKDLEKCKFVKDLNVLFSNGLFNMEGAFEKTQNCRAEYVLMDTNRTPLSFIAGLPLEPEAAKGTLDRMHWFEASWNPKIKRGSELRESRNYRDNFDHLIYRRCKVNDQASGFDYVPTSVGGKSDAPFITFKELREYAKEIRDKNLRNFERMLNQREIYKRAELANSVAQAEMGLECGRFITSILLQGAPGEGKSTLVQYIKNSFKKQMLDITEFAPQLNQILMAPTPSHIPNFPTNPSLVILDDILTEATMNTYGEALEIKLMEFYNNLPNYSMLLVCTNIQNKRAKYTSPFVHTTSALGVLLPVPMVETVYNKIFKATGLYRRMGFHGNYMNEENTSYNPILTAESYTTNQNINHYVVTSGKATNPTNEVAMCDVLADRLVDQYVKCLSAISEKPFNDTSVVPNKAEFEMAITVDKWQDLIELLSPKTTLLSLIRSGSVKLSPASIQKCSSVRFSDVQIVIPPEPTIESVLELIKYFSRVLRRYSITIPIVIEIKEIGFAWFDGENFFINTNLARSDPAKVKHVCFIPQEEMVVVVEDQTIVYEMPAKEYYMLFIRSKPPLEEMIKVPFEFRSLLKNADIQSTHLDNLLLQLENQDTQLMWKGALVRIFLKAKEFFNDYKWYFAGIIGLFALVKAIKYLFSGKSTKFDVVKYEQYLTLKFNNTPIPEELQMYMDELPASETLANRDTIADLNTKLDKIPATKIEEKPLTVFDAMKDVLNQMVGIDEKSKKTGTRSPTAAVDPSSWDDMKNNDDVTAKAKAVFTKATKPEFDKDDWNNDPGLWEKTQQTVKHPDFNAGAAFSPEKRLAIIERNICIINGLGICFALGIRDKYLVTVGHVAFDGKTKLSTAKVSSEEIGNIEVSLVYLDPTRDISVWKTPHSCFKDITKWIVPDAITDRQLAVTMARIHKDTKIFLTGTLTDYTGDSISQINIDGNIKNRTHLYIQSYPTVSDVPTTRGDCGLPYFLNDVAEGKPFLYSIHALGYRHKIATGSTRLDKSLIDSIISKDMAESCAEKGQCICCENKMGPIVREESSLKMVDATKQHFDNTPQRVIYDSQIHTSANQLLKKFVNSQMPKYPFYMNHGTSATNSINHPHIHIYKMADTKYQDFLKIAKLMKIFNVTHTSTLFKKKFIHEKEVWINMTPAELEEHHEVFKPEMQICGIFYNNRIFGVVYPDGPTNVLFFGGGLLEHAKTNLHEYKVEENVGKQVVVTNFQNKLYCRVVPSKLRQETTKFNSLPSLSQAIAVEGDSAHIFVRKDKTLKQYIAPAVQESDEDLTYNQKLTSELTQSTLNLINGREPYVPSVSILMPIGVSTPISIPVKSMYKETPFSDLATKANILREKIPIKSLEEMTLDEKMSLGKNRNNTPCQLANQVVMLDENRPIMTTDDINQIALEMAPGYLPVIGKYCTFSTPGEVLSGSNALDSNLSKRNVINFSAMETDSGCGVSLTKLYKMTKKSEVIDVNEQGVRKWKTTPPAMQIRHAYEQNVEMIAKNERPLVFFQTCVKPELLPTAKAYKGRVYECDDLMGVLLERHVWGRVVARLSNGDFATPCRVGIDPDRDFNTMIKMHSKYNNHFSGDFSRWDKRVTISLCRILGEILNICHRAYYHQNEECNCGWVNSNNTMITTVFTALRFVYDTYYLTMGMPSGTYVTAVFNSMLIDILAYTAFRKCFPHPEWKYNEYKNNVINSTYGDDWLCSVSDKVKGKYNLEALVPIVFGISGAVLDSDQKDGKLYKYTNDLSKVSFISRTPILQPTGIYLGALKKITINSWFHWVRKQDNSSLEQGVMISNINSALWEASSWEPEYFNKIRNFVQTTSIEHDFLTSVPLPSYEEFQRMRLINAMGLRRSNLKLTRKLIDNKMNSEQLLLTKANIASAIAKSCLEIQTALAEKVMEELNIGKIYIFDTSKTFENAENKITNNGIRYKQYADSYAVLSQAAQECILAKLEGISAQNTYQQILNRRTEADGLGLYLQSLTTWESQSGQQELMQSGEFEKYILEHGAMQCNYVHQRVANNMTLVRVSTRLHSPGDTSDYQRFVGKGIAPTYREARNEAEYHIYLQAKQVLKDIEEAEEQMESTPNVGPNCGSFVVNTQNVVTPLPPPVNPILDNVGTMVPIIGDTPATSMLPNAYNWDAVTTWRNAVHPVITLNLTTKTTLARLWQSNNNAIDAISKWVAAHTYVVGGITYTVSIISPTGTKGRVGMVAAPYNLLPATYELAQASYPFKEISLDGDSTFTFTTRYVQNTGMALSSLVSSSENVWNPGFEESLGLYLIVPIASTYNATATDLLTTIRITAKLSHDFKVSIPKVPLSEIWKTTTSDVTNFMNSPLSTMSVENGEKVSIIVTDTYRSNFSNAKFTKTPIWAEFDQTSQQRFEFATAYRGSLFRPNRSSDLTSNAIVEIPIFACGLWCNNFQYYINSYMSLRTGDNLEVAFMYVLSQMYANVMKINPVWNTPIPSVYTVRTSMAILSGDDPNIKLHGDIKVRPNLSFYWCNSAEGTCLIAVDLTSVTSKTSIDQPLAYPKSYMGDDKERFYMHLTSDRVLEYWDEEVSMAPFVSNSWTCVEEAQEVHLQWGDSYSLYLNDLVMPETSRFFGFINSGSCILPTDEVWENDMIINGSTVTAWSSTTASFSTFSSLTFGYPNQSSLLTAGQVAIPSTYHYRLGDYCSKNGDGVYELAIDGNSVGFIGYEGNMGFYCLPSTKNRMLINVNTHAITLKKIESSSLTRIFQTDYWSSFISNLSGYRMERAQEQMWAAAALGGMGQGLAGWAAQQQKIDADKEMQGIKGAQAMEQIAGQGRNAANVANINAQSSSDVAKISGRNARAIAVINQDGNLVTTKQQGANALANTTLIGQNQQANIKLANDQKLQNAGLLSAANSASGTAVNSKATGSKQDSVAVEGTASDSAA